MVGAVYREDGTQEPARGLVNVVHVVYALHALSLIIGITTAMTIVTAFVFGWPSIIAVVLNYLKRGEARGTWLESHFRWQIRTFWWALLWFVVGVLLFLALVGFLISPLIFILVGCWACYRIVRGWLALNAGRSLLN